MPTCEICKIVYLAGESHACAGRPTSFAGRWRAVVGGELWEPAFTFRRVLIAWVVALALTSPLVLLTGELLGPEAFLVSLLAFPSGLFDLLPTSDLGIATVSPMARSAVGWMLYGAVVVLLLVSRRRQAHRRVFMVLSVLLGLNVVGCYAPLLGGSWAQAG